ncbi:MltA domain-containing protein [Niveispirillum sp.]|uniref:murein transglycosylase A n=1 Tax=Niveispirillum sp. TaxID=1917217 RepID=UPI001B42F5A2|nr:MltA domain-containing protein [Niveispirillum sp.]MBP7335014.1 murein transglycosylase A [Niveispirillum sp.]
MRISPLAALFALGLLAGCAQQPAKPPVPSVPPVEAEKPAARLTLRPVRFADLPGWSVDRTADALPALLKSCDRLVKQPADRALGPNGTMGRIGDWTGPCAVIAKLPAGDHVALRRAVEELFQPWAAGDNGNEEGLFTGYYESALRGSPKRQGKYQTPLYKRPSDLVMVDLGEFRPNLKGERIAGRVVDGQLKPYADRRSIEAGALNGKGLELLYVDDPVDAFFLQIQGSGRVTLPDGSQIRVGYDGQNGQPYFAIGRELVARGALAKEDVSMQSIRAWLEANPSKATDVMNTNPSFVFFRRLEGEGPLGAQGVALTPGRSLAVDRTFIAYGVPVWLDAEDPVQAKTRVRRLLVAQDTGGAIRGPVRGDVFWGHGAEAEQRAGLMKSSGRYWLLLPKGVTPPVS